MVDVRATYRTTGAEVEAGSPAAPDAGSLVIREGDRSATITFPSEASSWTPAQVQNHINAGLDAAGISARIHVPTPEELAADHARREAAVLQAKRDREMRKAWLIGLRHRLELASSGLPVRLMPGEAEELLRYVDAELSGEPSDY